MTPRVAIIGVGNAWRHDDGVGWAVAEAAARRLGQAVDIVESDGEPSRLIDAWAGVDVAVVVDAVCSGAPPGTVHVWADRPDGAARSASSGGSHALGLADAIALGRALHRLPARLIIVGIEADDTTPGHGLSSAVAAAVDDAVDVIAQQLSDATSLAAVSNGGCTGTDGAPVESFGASRWTPRTPQD